MFGFGSARRGARNRREWLHEEEQALLRHGQHDQGRSAIPPMEVTKVALRLRHLIIECVPCELEESEITQSHSRIITPKVIKAAKEAGGKDHGGCVVYALLVNMRWFRREAVVELWDADLHNIRALACGVIAKHIIEGEENLDYLLHTVLLKRYAFIADKTPTAPINVVEKAVDLHAIEVIASSGYQKCISYLWRGWLVQDEDDPSVFVDYKNKDNRSFIVHMDPDRMRAPVYQNTAQMLLSVVYLGLYTSVINTVNPEGNWDAAEVILYLFTIGYVCDEVMKVWKAGPQILGFWNALNSMLFAFLTASFILRVIGLSHPEDDPARSRMARQSYNVLAFIAPLFWSRMLLYLDGFKFFGAMLVVLKVMMKESAIFFALLLVVNIGFLQAFIGLDLADDLVAGDVFFVIESMIKAILQAPEFDGFENFGHPWGLILYYCFTFVVMIILLNILIALYNSAYEDIYGNADDEYMALFAQKTMQFVRAPDENVFIAPFNLIEIVISGLLEWWMPKKQYEMLNDWIMAVIYSPLLVAAAFFETRAAYSIHANRARGEEDDDVVQEWEEMAHEIDFESEGWTKTCEMAKSDVEVEPAVAEVRKLQAEVDELKALLANISKAVGASAQLGEGAKKGKDTEDGAQADDR